MAEMTKEEVKNLTPEVKKAPVKNHRYQRDLDREMVTGKFIYHEVPGGVFEFVYKAHKGDDVEKFTFMDQGIYKIPRGVARHLNTNVWYPKYDYVPGEAMMNAVTGTTPHGGHVGRLMKITQKVRRVSFMSMEFLDVEGVPTNPAGVVTVEATPL